MAENLREVIQRLKAQNSPQSQKTAVKPVEKVAPAPDPIPVEDDEEEFMDEETEQTVQETPKTEEKAVENKVNSKNTENTQNTEDQQKLMQQRAIIQQIEAFQNNGVFRLELLDQLDEIKRALMIIAKVLVDLTPDDKQKT
jgi:hypothetical protein